MILCWSTTNVMPSTPSSTYFDQEAGLEFVDLVVLVVGRGRPVVGG
jgi:hypothetical protein